MLESEPKGIMLAATLVPKRLTAQHPAQRKMAKRTSLLQYLSMIASRRSHWFQSERPHALLMAAVDKIPRLADRVTAIGLVINCDHIAPDLVLDHLAISGWLVMRVAVFPRPALTAFMKNHPHLPDALTPEASESFSVPNEAPVLAIQKMNKPHTAGIMSIVLTLKKVRSWYGRINARGKCASQKRKKASMPAEVIPWDAGIRFGMSVKLCPNTARSMLATSEAPEKACTPNQTLSHLGQTPVFCMPKGNLHRQDCSSTHEVV